MITRFQLVPMIAQTGDRKIPSMYTFPWPESTTVVHTWTRELDCAYDPVAGIGA